MQRSPPTTGRFDIIVTTISRKKSGGCERSGDCSPDAWAEAIAPMILGLVSDPASVRLRDFQY
jgi:hypothetical protein